MPKIFISYRRSDSEDIARRICDRLIAHFGKDSIFFDVDTIPFGIDFRDFLKAEVQQCQVLIALIGPDWLSTTDSNGDRRLDNPADWVRIEIESALARNIPVIPLLVRGARLPRPNELPDSLQNLAYRNAATARPGRDFHRDMDVLISGLETLIERFIATEPSTAEAQPPSTVGWASPTSPQPPAIYPSFEFETVTVDDRGEIIARTPKTAEYCTEDLGNGIALELVKIPAGQFLMGSPDSEEGHDGNEGPQHSVMVPEFWLGKYPVTQAQYQAITGKSPSRFSENGSNRPVEQVSWYDALAFCEKLSQQTGRTYRMPSEAEWEYACRAGTTTPFHFGPTLTTDLANYDGRESYVNEPKGLYREQTTKVGSFSPNVFGLYDMHGNVVEWCADHWHGNYAGAPTDGSAWLSDGETASRVLRSGSWGFYPWFCRSADRKDRWPGYGSITVGFRVCCSAPRT